MLSDVVGADVDCGGGRGVDHLEVFSTDKIVVKLT